jgi:hypothetical protein
VEAAYNAGLCNEPVLLSLENKERRGLFSKWRILNEPVSDIYSLMYYSKGVASNGDSMAREAAQLGVPSVYMGSRRMIANDVLYALGLMHHIAAPGAMLDFFQHGSGGHAADPEKARGRLAATWEDPVDVLTRALYGLAAC